jgi:3-oxoacyl-[acyl-carrier protein] reductase
MSAAQAQQRSAVVFGARNLGRAIIELLIGDGWAVIGAARTQSTLDGIKASGALPLAADVTDPASVCMECSNMRPPLMAVSTSW